jgi:hypothetical protein
MEDGDTLILPANQCACIFWHSFLFFGTAGYGYTKQLYDFAFLGIWVGCTSLNYWRKPTSGWRRNMDMISVIFGLVYHIYRAFYSDIWGLYLAFVYIGCMTYFWSWAMYSKNVWVSTLLHISAQLIANIANILLLKNIC